MDNAKQETAVVKEGQKSKRTTTTKTKAVRTINGKSLEECAKQLVNGFPVEKIKRQEEGNKYPYIEEDDMSNFLNETISLFNYSFQCEPPMFTQVGVRLLCTVKGSLIVYDDAGSVVKSFDNVGSDVFNPDNKKDSLQDISKNAMTDCWKRCLSKGLKIGCKQLKEFSTNHPVLSKSDKTNVVSVPNENGTKAPETVLAGESIYQVVIDGPIKDVAKGYYIPVKVDGKDYDMIIWKSNAAEILARNEMSINGFLSICMKGASLKVYGEYKVYNNNHQIIFGGLANG